MTQIARLAKPEDSPDTFEAMNRVVSKTNRIPSLPDTAGHYPAVYMHVS